MKVGKTLRDASAAAILVIGTLTAFSAEAGDTGRIIRLTPNGFDDTAQLQAALDSCSGARTPCRIVLGRGIFYTDVLLVHDFRGRIRGQGAGRTIVRPLAGTPLRSTERPFSADPTLDEPYPVLLHFADGGDVELRNFTLEFPADMQVEPWRIPAVVEDALLAAILMDGDEDDCARLVITGIEVLAADKGLGTSLFSNLLNGIRFEGQLRLPSPDAEDVIANRLGNGEFVAHQNHVRRSGHGFALRDTMNTNVRIFDNDVQDTRFSGVFLSELGASHITVRGNRLASDEIGIFHLRGGRALFSGTQPPSDKPSIYLLTDNILNINGRGNSPFGAPEGISVNDLMTFVDPALSGIDTINIRRNDIVLGAAAFDAIFIGGDRGHVTIAQNRMWGPAAYSAIYIDESIGTRTRHNVFAGFSPEVPDVILSEFTSECQVNEPTATVLDDGTDNVVRAATVLRSP